VEGFSTNIALQMLKNLSTTSTQKPEIASLPTLKPVLQNRKRV